MATYQSQYTGQQIDAAVAFGMSPDATPTQNSTKGVTSGGVYAETSALKSALGADVDFVNTALGLGDVSALMTWKQGYYKADKSLNIQTTYITTQLFKVPAGTKIRARMNGSTRAEIREHFADGTGNTINGYYPNYATVASSVVDVVYSIDIYKSGGITPADASTVQIFIDTALKTNLDGITTELGKTMEYVAQLGGSDNLNSTTKAGHYYVLGSSLPTNYPFTTTGRVLVIKSTTETNHLAEWQIAVSNNNTMKFRFTSDGTTWGAWSTVNTDVGVMRYIKQLTSTDNLNNVAESGHYYVMANNRPANWPSTGTGRLLVVKSNTADNHGFEWQLVINEYGNVMRYRCCPNSTNEWTEWATVKTDSNVVASFNPISLYSVGTNIPSIYDVMSSGGYANMMLAVYGLWDSLVTQYPQFVKKTTLNLSDNIVETLPSTSGYADGDTVLISASADSYYQYRLVDGSWVQMFTWDDNGDPVYTVKLDWPLYSYTIEPFKNSGYKELVWISGLHGQEHVSHVSTYYMFKELLDNYLTAPQTNSVLSNYKIVVVPIAGPSSAASSNPGEHSMSQNGVNPNRDFPYNWSQHTDAYNRTGNVPLYDPYDRMLQEFILAQTDVLYLMQKHDSSTLTVGKKFGYIVDAISKSRQLEKLLFTEIDMMLRVKYSWIYSDFIGTTWNPNSTDLNSVIASQTYTGTLDQYTNSLGICGGILEVAPNAGTDYNDLHSADFRQIHTEIGINLLSGITHNIGWIEN